MIPTLAFLLTPLVAPAPDLEIHLYDVAALTGSDRLASLVAAMEATNAEGGRAALDRYETLSAGVDRRAAELATSIRGLIRPPFDESLHAVAVLDGCRLAFVGSTEQHAWLRDVLDAMKSFDGYVDVQGRVLQLPRGFLAELDMNVGSGSFLSDAEVERLLHELMQRDAATLVMMPRVTFTPLQTASLSVLNEIPYIADYERTEVSGETVLDPVILTVQEGLLLELRAVPLPDGRLALSCRLDNSVVPSPILQFSTTFDGKLSEPVVVQLPEVRTLRAEGRFDLWPSEHVLLIAPDEQGDAETAVLLRCNRVGPAGELTEPATLEDERRSRLVGAQIAAIHAALDAFALRNGGRWPGELEWLVLKDENGRAYLPSPEAIVDPWGRNYAYELGQGGGTPRVSTLGADGAPGGEGEDADVSLGDR